MVLNAFYGGELSSFPRIDKITVDQVFLANMEGVKLEFMQQSSQIKDKGMVHS